MNSQSETIFFDRYALRDAAGELLETDYSQLIQRLTNAFAINSSDIVKFVSALEKFRFVPGGRILSSTGGDSTLFNCFVIAIQCQDPAYGADSRRAIMQMITEMIEICSRGGGVGVNWSVLRPEGAHIAGVNGKSSGPIAWMQGADALADQIRQGGSRTAALMWMLDIWHPGMLNFINRTERFLHANYSVGISDDFMQSVAINGTWELEFPETTHEMYNSMWDGDLTFWRNAGYPIQTYHTLKAQTLFDGICESAHRLGSPGMVFLDTCNAMSNTWWLGKLRATNPCGEQPLPPDGSCNLGSVNLVEMWDFTSSSIDFERLSNTVESAVRFLDRTTDISKDIITRIGDHQRSTRRVGLGTMGLADVLIMSGVRYGSRRSLREIDEIYEFIRDTAYNYSVDLAIEFGEAPALDREKFLQGGFIRTLPEDILERIDEHGIRNLALLSQAPTGTTSLLAGVSSGIEPIFSKEYVRTDATGEHLMIHPLFQDDSGDHLVTSHEINFKDHIAVQARIQKYIDSAVSKTINMPPCASPDQIGEAYELAWKSGCKGITVYRDGSLEGVCKSCELN